MKQKPMTALRTARLVDAERIFALIHLHRDRLVPRSLGNIVENIDRFVVAEVDGEMVGCATYGIFPEIGEPLHTAVEIQSVAVRAPWRRQGVGRALVQEIVRREMTGAIDFGVPLEVSIGTGDNWLDAH